MSTTTELYSAPLSLEPLPISALTGEANTHITICRPKYLNIVVHYGSK